MKIEINQDDIVRHFGRIDSDGNSVGNDIWIFSENANIAISYYDIESVAVMLYFDANSHSCNGDFSISIPLLIFHDKNRRSFIETSCISHDYDTDNLIEILNDSFTVSVLNYDGVTTAFQTDIRFYKNNLLYFNKYIFGIHWKDFMEQIVKHPCTVRILT